MAPLRNRRAVRRSLKAAFCRWWLKAIPGGKSDSKVKHRRTHICRFPAEFRAASHVVKRLVRSHARTLSGLQRCVREVLESEGGAGRHHPTIAWRIEQAGTRGH